MNNYTEFKVQTAKDLMKEGYKWVTKSIHGTIWAYDELNPSKAKWLNCTPIYEHIDGGVIVSLDSIISAPILSEEERIFLSKVINPYRKHVTSICKRQTSYYKEYIEIHEITYHFLPDFDIWTKYKGIEIDKEYTLKELGL